MISEYLRYSSGDGAARMTDLITYQDPMVEIRSIRVNGHDSQVVILASDENALDVEIIGELREPKTMELEVQILRLTGNAARLLQPRAPIGGSSAYR